MAATALDLKYYLTGATSDGAVQSVTDLALGGYRSNVEIFDNSINNLCDDITASQRIIDYDDYRCFCVKNTHATDSMTNVKVWIEEPESSVYGVFVRFLLEVPTSNPSTGYAQSIASESVAPSLSVNTNGSWVSPNAKQYGIPIDINGHSADLAAGEVFFVWVRRTIADEDPALPGILDFTIFVEGDVV